MDQTVADAFGEELNATFESVRDMLLDAGSLNSVVDNPDTDEDETKNPEQAVNGYVFIDKADGTVGGTTNVIGTYKDYGPKNEVYLAPGNAIAFYVGTEVEKLHVGLKAPKGGAATAKVSGGGFADGLTVGHTTDLYYEVSPDANGFVVIQNASDKDGPLLSVTKVADYSGIYLEDGSDGNVSGIAVALLCNTGDEAIEYVDVTMVYEDKTLVFKASAIPAGARIAVQEMNKVSCSDGALLECSASIAALETLDLAEDSLRLEDNGDNSITITPDE